MNRPLSKEEIGNKHGLMMHDPIQKYHIGNAMDEYAKQECKRYAIFIINHILDPNEKTPNTDDQLYTLYLKSKIQGNEKK